MKSSDGRKEKAKLYQVAWRERNREKSKEYFKKRRELIKQMNSPLLSKSDEKFPLKLENSKIWEARYREEYEKTYGKIEK